MLLGLALALSCVLSSVTSQGTIDPYDCQDLGGAFGIEVFCPTGMVAVGACGSGSSQDCAGGQGQILRCCRVLAATNEVAACSGHSGNHGDDYVCPDGQQIISLCGSGRNSDCGVNDIYTKSTCCDGNGITTDANSFCRWAQGDTGQMLSCSPSEVMTGYCGSGSASDCNGFHTEIQCCSYS